MPSRRQSSACSISLLPLCGAINFSGYDFSCIACCPHCGPSALVSRRAFIAFGLLHFPACSTMRFELFGRLFSQWRSSARSLLYLSFVVPMALSTAVPGLFQSDYACSPLRGNSVHAGRPLCRNGVLDALFFARLFGWFAMQFGLLCLLQSLGQCSAGSTM